MNKEFDKKLIKATKWSTYTEIAAKLINPLISMVLARLLTPENFAIIATITMITSFVNMFTDAGFQKYLIHKEFDDDKILFNHANVAFLTNLAMSISIWILIYIFKDDIASVVGNDGLGLVISIASVQIIFTAFSSIQIAILRKKMMFKELFYARLATIFVPVIVTIPLALLGYGYWSIIIGNLFVHFVNAVVLTIISTWKPKLYYKFSDLKKMFSFTAWSLLESLSIWLTSWADIFIISYYFTTQEVGLFKTSTALVTTIMSIVTASIAPVLFSSLSKLQRDEKKFNQLFLSTIKFIAIIILPMGILLYTKSNLFTYVLLGNQWGDASFIVGIWGLCNAVKIVFCNFSSEAFRAKGYPKVSFLSQILHLVFFIPLIIYSAQYGFEKFVYIRSISRIQFVIVNLILIRLFIKIQLKDFINQISYTVLSAIILYLVLSINITGGKIIYDIIHVIVGGLIYLSFIIANKKNRDIIKIYIRFNKSIKEI